MKLIVGFNYNKIVMNETKSNKTKIFSGTNRSKILLKAAVFTVPLETCNETLVRFNKLSNQPSLRGLNPTQMCALNRKTRSDACQGDSGGS